jgi:hypothetical protein
MVSVAAEPLRRVDPWDARGDRKVYLVWVGLMWAGLLAGFGLDIPYYFLNEIPRPAWIIYVHAAVFTGWMLILTTQVMLIQSNRFALHQKIGKLALWWAALMMLVGPAAFLTKDAQLLAHPHADQSFIVFMAANISDIGGFGLFTAAGYFLRRDPASHKRMMMLAIVALADPGFSRITGVLLNPFPTAFLPNLIATFYGNFLLLGLMAGWDLWRRGTLNRAFAIGAVLLAGSEVGAIALQYSPVWKQIAIAITRTWGYAG